MRLTPKQEDKLLAIADFWGPSFHSFDGFLRDKKLVRPASPEEVNAHYEAQCAELATTHVKLGEAVRCRRYQEAQHLAEHAHYLLSATMCRDEWEESTLVTLSDLGLAEAAKIRAKRERKNTTQG